MNEEKIYCWYCDKEITNEDRILQIIVLDTIHYVHKECHQLSKKGSSNHVNQNVRNISQNPINILRIVAWLTLLIGIVGAILIWSTMSTMEVPYTYVPGTHTESNPVGIGLGFATLFSSIVTWALLSVICDMAENLIQIRNSVANTK